MNMQALYRYAARLIVFVSVWVVVHWIIIRSKPVETVLPGVFAWSLSEFLIGGWTRFTGNKKRR